MSEADSRAESEGDPRPWEEPGAFRRDCAPHRAGWLQLLGGVAVLCGVLSWLGLPALVAVPCGAIGWALAERDLARMRAGLMDPSGRNATEKARACGRFAVFVGLGLGWIVPLLWLFSSSSPR